MGGVIVENRCLENGWEKGLRKLILWLDRVMGR